jgi:GT2 family glycosyltransferase
VRLSIIIVSWNVRQHLVTCLRSIEENKPHAEFEIIVVDNASSDDTVNCIRHDFPKVTVIANKENRGFAAANNQGIRKAQGQYLLFLNPDTIVHPDSLDVLMKFMDRNSDVGACGPKLLNEDGIIQPSARRFPTFRGALYRHTAFKFLRIFRGEYKKWLMKDFSHDKQMDVDQVMGAALMTRRSIIDELGTMDERFFMYYEDVDLCHRIKQAGWRIVFTPDAVITHFGGRSSIKIPVRRRMMMLASLLRFFRKHRGRFTTFAFSCVFKPSIILRDIYNFATGSLTYIFATLALNKRRREKSVANVKNSTILLVKYSWQLLVKM